MRISSSTRSVEMGSSAEQGSSIRITSGCTATARAMQRRCCWPSDSASASPSSPSRTSSQRSAARRLRSTRAASPAPRASPSTRGPKATLSKTDWGKGLGRWKTIPTRRRRSTTSAAGSSTSRPSSRIRPVTRAPGMVSFIRFRQRRKVDLPHPEGPMRAVMALRPMPMETSRSASRLR